jgi:YVTN family beta-propeller protein
MSTKLWQTLCLLLFASLSIGLNACDDEHDPESPQYFQSPGMFICNEGPFQSGTGTVDYYNTDSKKLSEDIFGDANGFPLGNIVQSMLRVGDTIYIVVNNANKIVLVHAADFKKIGSIEGLTLPRFMHQVSGNKAYVTCWDNSVAIVNLKTLSVTGHIPVGTGPEKMLQVGSRMLVLNQGGFSVDSTISIINTATDLVEQTLQVHPKPSGIVALKGSGDIWVMCSGKGFDGWPMPDDTRGYLLKLNQGPVFQLETAISFADNTNHPIGLVENPWRNELLFLYKQAIYSQPTQSIGSDFQPFISRGISYYGLNFFDRGSAASSFIVASDPVDYIQKGWVYLFRASDGQLMDSIHSGVIPTDFMFLQ